MEVGLVLGRRIGGVEGIELSPWKGTGRKSCRFGDLRDLASAREVEIWGQGRHNLLGCI